MAHTRNVLWAKVSSLALIFFAMSACSLFGSSVAAGPTPSPTTAAKQSHTIQLETTNAKASQQLSDGLLVQITGIQCGGPYIVLRDATQTYSATDAAAIHAALNVSPRQPTDLVDIVSGDMICEGTLELTNVSGHSIQVSGITFTLLQDAQSNTYTYHLIDDCSLKSDCPSYGGQSQGPECIVEMQVMGTQTGASVEGDFAQNDQCPTSLDDKEDVFVILRMRSVTPSEKYVGSLALIIDGAPQTLPNSFDSTLIFATPSQITCDAYNPTTQQFVALASFPVFGTADGVHECV